MSYESNVGQGYPFCSGADTINKMIERIMAMVALMRAYLAAVYDLTIGEAKRINREADSTREALVEYTYHLDELVVHLGGKHEPLPRGERAQVGISRLVAGAVGLLVVLMVLGLAALMGGEFIGAIPSDSIYSNVTTDLQDHGETAFVLFAVSLLALPVVAVLGYIIISLGPFVGGFFGAGGGGSFGR